MAAEHCDVPAVEHGADGQRVLGGAEVGEAADACVRLHNDVKLAGAPDDGVELAFTDAPSFEYPGTCGKAHIHDQRLHTIGRAARFGALRRLGEKVHPSTHAVTGSKAKAIQYLG